LSRGQRLTTVLVLNLALVAGLVAVGTIAHSLAVLAEGGDYLLDAAAIGVAIVALWLSTSTAKGRRRSYPSATIVAALINAGWLLTLELIVSAAAARPRRGPAHRHHHQLARSSTDRKAIGQLRSRQAAQQAGQARH